MAIFNETRKRGPRSETNLKRFNVKFKEDEIDKIDELISAAGAANDAEFCRMLINHWAETHPSARKTERGKR